MKCHALERLSGKRRRLSNPLKPARCVVQDWLARHERLNYGIAAYGTLYAPTVGPGYKDAARLLAERLKEEKQPMRNSPLLRNVRPDGPFRPPLPVRHRQPGLALTLLP